MLDVRTTLIRMPRWGSLPFAELAERILGKRYELSLVVCGDKLAERMNKEHRNKTYSPNVLSFPLSRTEGEVFLNLRKTEREAGLYHIAPRGHLAHLFVHGCFHLKGLKHGRIMEKRERDILRAFGFHAKNLYGN